MRYLVVDANVLVELAAWFLRYAVAARLGRPLPTPTKVVNTWRQAMNVGVLLCTPEHALSELRQVGFLRESAIQAVRQVIPTDQNTAGRLADSLLTGLLEGVLPALVSVCPEAIYAGHLGKARARAVPEDDAPYLALGLALDAPIWTKNLTDLAGRGHPVWTTAYIHLAFAED